MPLQTQPLVEVPLGGTFDQSKGELLRGPNVLAEIANGDHDKQGYLVKARGYVRIPTVTSLNSVAPEEKFVSVAINEEELILIGQKLVFTVMTATEIVDGNALVFRGRAMIGNIRVGLIHATGISE